MAGMEYGRAWLGGNKPDRWSDYAMASPSRVCDLPQTLLEPILVRFATSHGFDVRYKTEFLRFEERDNGKVLSRLRDLVTGLEYHVVSRYLCGADGGRSPVAKQLDLPMVSQPGPPAYNLMVKAEMGKLMQHRKGTLHYCLKLDKDYPFIPLWRVVKPWHEWILIIFPKPGQSYDEPTHEQWMEVIRETIGDPSIEAEILGVSRWVINETYSQQYSKGNIFCLGDAVHRHPPTGGLGSNTCIQDATTFIEIETEKEGHADSLLSTPILRAMYCADVLVIGDTLQVISYVDNQCSRNGRQISGAPMSWARTRLSLS